MSKEFFMSLIYFFTVIYLSIGAAYLAHEVGNKIYHAPPPLHTFNNCLYYYFDRNGEVVHLPGRGRGTFEFAPSDQECGE